MRCPVALVLIVCALCGLAFLQVSNAQAIQTSPVPEFTLKYVDYSYDTAPITSNSTDLYTGKVTTTTIPGYHIGNRTIEATIQNSIGASYYNFRYKGHYTDQWSYYPFGPSSSGYSLGDTFFVPYQASNSSSTVAALPSYFFESVPAGGRVDVQVQALFGGFRAVPYGHVVWVGGLTYDFYFEGNTSDWSTTQTITIPDASASPSPDLSPSLTPFSSAVESASPLPSPTVPEFPFWIILPLGVLASVFAIMCKRGVKRG